MMSTLKIPFLLFLSIIFWGGCRQNVSHHYLQMSEYNRTIHSITTMEPGKTTLVLGDYFAEAIPNTPFFAKGLHIEADSVQQKINITPTDNTPFLSLLKYTIGTDTFAIPFKKSAKKRVHFSFSPQGKKYQNVQLVGDINAWNPANTPLTWADGAWVTDLNLTPGIYGYQVVVDKKWILDPNNPDQMENGIGGHNSRLVVKGPEKEALPSLTSSQFSDTEIVLQSTNSEQVVALWQNQILLVKKGPNGQYEIPISQLSKTTGRSFIRAWAYNKHGISQDMLIPLASGKVVADANQLNRFDKETNNIYFVFVDRFFNGRNDNDRPLDNPAVHPRANVHGGDLAGVIDQLKNGYFDSLGFTAIWLSPIVQNPEGAFGFYNEKGIVSKFSAFHGYWPISFSEIDQRFGTADELKEIVNIAHEKGINVYLDFVANHVHELHPVYQANKDKGWATNLYLPDGSLNTEKWDEHRLTTWFDVFLPTLNLEKQEVTEMLSDSALYWLETYGIDGFRHDATKHIPKNFWRTLTKKVRKYEKEHGHPVFQIGETYGTPELINSYIGTGMLDGQFDFNVYDALLSSISRDDVGFELVAEKLNQSFDYYGVHNLMGYMTGNQDKPRFMAMATGDVRFDEDAKYAGWSRLIQKKTDIGYKKLAIMHAILQTIPGIPVAYYGDEIGLTGGNDPDNRRDMRFDGLTPNELALRQTVSKLTRNRRNHLAFLYGDFTFLENQSDILAYSRQFFHSFGLVVVNNSKEEKTIQLDLPKGIQIDSLYEMNQFPYAITSGQLKVVLPPNSFEIFLTKK